MNSVIPPLPCSAPSVKVDTAQRAALEKEIHALLALTGIDVAVADDSLALARKADELFEGGVFKERAAAQDFVGRLAVLARGARLAPAMEAYLLAQAKLTEKIKALGAMRDEAERQHLAQLRLRRSVDVKRKALARERQNIAWAEQAFAEIEKDYVPGDSRTLGQIIAVGANYVGLRESIRIMREACDRLEAEISSEESTLEAQFQGGASSS
jgi:hypothetical protein